ncbi:MAG: type II secretion system protein [Candidatus Doudnabacteria bacterium]|nr:type II secretion system protein [Candidatus Doudnabacteria bacterium]
MSSTFSLDSNGFSLVEIVIGMALFTMATTVVFAGGIKWYQRAVLNSNKIALVAELARARSQSLFGRDGGSHGVFVSESGYVSFVGDEFDSEDLDNRVYEFDPGISAENSSLVVVFELGKALVEEPVRINLSADSESSTQIELSEEGVIVW